MHSNKMTSYFIFYVQDQNRSKEFYKYVLDKEPIVDVPGITEFELGDGAILGLMPEADIKSLLGPEFPDPARAKGILSAL